MKKLVDDDFLYVHIPIAEEIMMRSFPAETEIDHSFSSRFKRKMKRLLKYEQYSPAMRSFVRCCKTAAIIFLVIIGITLTTVISVEAYRVPFFEFVTTVWEEFTSVFISSEDNADFDTIVPVTPAYVSKGYTILEAVQTKYTNTIIYCNKYEEEIFYSQKLKTQSELIFDSEDVNAETITIGSKTVSIVINKGKTQLYWYDEISSYSLIGINKNELLKMAESTIQKTIN